MKGFQLIVPLITLFFDKSASADKVILIDASKLGEEYKDANGFKKLYLLYHQYFAISSQAIAKLEERKMPQSVAKSSKPIPQAVGQLEEKMIYTKDSLWTPNPSPQPETILKPFSPFAYS